MSTKQLNTNSGESTGPERHCHVLCDICGADLGGNVRRSFCRDCGDVRKYLPAARRALSKVARNINVEEAARIRGILFGMANLLPSINRHSKRGKDGRFC